MDIRQIRYLVSAIEGGALSAAAKKQFVTVQAVSKAIFSERGLESPILETRSPSRSVPEELRTRQAYLFAVYLKSLRRRKPRLPLHPPRRARRRADPPLPGDPQGLQVAGVPDVRRLGE